MVTYGCELARAVETLILTELSEEETVTLLWFIVWLVANVIGDHEPLLVDPVNWWAGTLLLAVALDLSRQHAADLGKRR